MAANFKTLKIALVVGSSLLILIGLVVKNEFGQQKPHQIAIDHDSNATPLSDHYFRDYGEPAYHLAQKIERKQDIDKNDLVALSPRAINQRYGDGKTLLFHALSKANMQAIDFLISNGADFTMAERPLLNSEPEFINAMVSFGGYDEAANRIYRNKLIEIYLKHGGDPNFIFRDGGDTPLVLEVAVTQNYAGVHILLEAGANIWTRDKIGRNLISLLGGQPTGYNEFAKLIDDGYFDNIAMGNIIDAMSSISSYTQRGDEESKNRQILAMKILKRYPQYKEDRSTQRIFGGPIPWDQINSLSIPQNKP